MGRYRPHDEDAERRDYERSFSQRRNGPARTTTVRCTYDTLTSVELPFHIWWYVVFTDAAARVKATLPKACGLMPKSAKRVRTIRHRFGLSDVSVIYAKHGLKFAQIPKTRHILSSLVHGGKCVSGNQVRRMVWLCLVCLFANCRRQAVVGKRRCVCAT